MVRRLRSNVKGRPVSAGSGERSIARMLLLTVAAVSILPALDLILAARRAQLVAGIVEARRTPPEVIMGAGRFVTSVDAPPACQQPATAAGCAEVVLHSRAYLGTTHSFRVRFEEGRRVAVERAGPWWFTQPFHAAGEP